MFNEQLLHTFERSEEDPRLALHIDQAKQSLEKMLDTIGINDPERLAAAREGLNSIVQKVIIQPLGGEGALGAYTSEHIVLIDPRVLTMNNDVIQRVIRHEFIHAMGFADESVVDFMAKYWEGDDNLDTGYKPLVDTLVDELGEHWSSPDAAISEILVEFTTDPVETLGNLIYKIFLSPYLNDIDALPSDEQLMELFNQKFDVIAKLFPRLANEVIGFGRSVDMSYHGSSEQIFAAVKSGVLKRLLQEKPELGTIEG